MWYVNKALLHSSIHHVLDLLVMLTNFEYLFQRSSAIDVNSWVTFSSISQLVILDISIEPSLYLSLLTNSFYLLLFLISHYFFSWINFFRVIDTDKGVWSDGLQKSGNMMWLLNSSSLKKYKVENGIWFLIICITCWYQIDRHW